MRYHITTRVQRVYSIVLEADTPEDALELAQQKSQLYVADKTEQYDVWVLGTDDGQNREIDQLDLRDADDVRDYIDNNVTCENCGEEVYYGQRGCACTEDCVPDPNCVHKNTKDYGEGPTCLDCGELEP